MIKICQYCGSEFNTKHGERDKFCSINCSSKGQGIRQGKTRWAKEQDEFLGKNSSYSNQELANILNKTKIAVGGRKHLLGLSSRNPSFEIQCLKCGKLFYTHRCKITRLIKIPGRFCSIACMTKWIVEKGVRQGENHPNWKGGKKKINYGSNWYSFRKSLNVLKCQDCRAIKSLQVHHIIEPQKFLLPDFANYRENVEILCRSCHIKKHQVRKRLRMDDTLRISLHPL